ncbi:MAG: hypothetical protein NWQ47_08310 [Crocinitomicaceae bacterium]|nr:hypothetical protein [Crocinitomicaceae bacterium]MDP5011214.1 hypothetical protein [Crocinitomicaceae bacterium]
MKKIFLFSLFIVCSLFFISNSYAQGNLQFNQVYTYSGSGGNSAIWTVPVGKIWKIESVLMVNMSGTSTFKINSFVVLYNNINPQPIWLKSGDFSQFSMSNAGNSYYISIVEFNIIP